MVANIFTQPLPPPIIKASYEGLVYKGIKKNVH